MEVSQLFNIEPIGVGTPYVESLPSYVKRLAEAHSVFPGVLLKNEIFPETRDYQLNAVLSYRNKLLLSISSDVVKDLIRVLEIKTNNHNIHNISLTNLSGYINQRYLLRNHAAWCPLCFEESRKNNEPVYEQVIWSFRDVVTCGKHGIKLHHLCPQCNKQFKPYEPLGRVGYCSHCKYWLRIDDGNSYNELNNWDIWTFNNIGSILSNIPKINLLSESCLRKNILEILKTTGTTQKKLGKEIAVSQSSIVDWALKSKKPTLSSVLLLSYKLGLSISQLFFEEINRDSINLYSSNEVPDLRKPKVNFNQLQQALKEALESTELVSIYKIIKKFGVERNTIKRHFPKEYDLLVKKNIKQKEEMAKERETRIREMTISLGERGIFPNAYRVSCELKKDGITSQRYCNIWKITMQELGYTGKDLI